MHFLSNGTIWRLKLIIMCVLVLIRHISPAETNQNKVSKWKFDQLIKSIENPLHKYYDNIMTQNALEIIGIVVSTIRFFFHTLSCNWQKFDFRWHFEMLTTSTNHTFAAISLFTNISVKIAFKRIGFQKPQLYISHTEYIFIKIITEYVLLRYPAKKFRLHNNKQCCHTKSTEKSRFSSFFTTQKERIWNEDFVWYPTLLCVSNTNTYLLDPHNFQI